MNMVCTRQQPNTALQRTEQRLSVRVRVYLPPLSFTVMPLIPIQFELPQNKPCSTQLYKELVLVLGEGITKI
jgi:hypothetical protein